MIVDKEDPFETKLDSPQYWLSLAKSGSPNAVNQLLKNCYDYLLLIATREIGTDLKQINAPSDLVQQTLYEAYRDFAKFRGETEGEILAWLRRILINNLADARKRHQAELRLRGGHDALDGNANVSARSGHFPDETPPIDRAISRENAVALEDAMLQLSDEHREALLLRHKSGLSFEQIGTRLGRSTDAARKLWSRAVERLKEVLKRQSTHDAN